MSQPDPGRPANASGAWPYGAPKPVLGHADPGNGTPGSETQPYEEWQRSILGVGRWKAYQMARTGEWEQIGIRIVPIGAKYRVSATSTLEVLGDTADSGTRSGISISGGPQTAGNEADDTITELPDPVASRSTP